MNKKGPIIIIEDDLDDQQILADVFAEIEVENEVIFFTDGLIAYDYLSKTKDRPFLILSDINMPKLNGFNLRQKVHNNEQLRLKCIPYIFFTTTSEQNMVGSAYSQSVQGFFVKPISYSEVKRIMRNIIEYWKDCHSPNVVV